jgi:hypothetical protein
MKIRGEGNMDKKPIDLVKLPSREKMQKITERLQKLMRLQDWNIEIKYISARAMEEDIDDAKCLADSVRDRRFKYAIINYNAEENQEDWYQTLVHEMTHVQTTELISFIKDIVDLMDSPESVSSFYKDTITNYYEQWMNLVADEFTKVYPVDNFRDILESEDGGK